MEVCVCVCVDIEVSVWIREVGLRRDDRKCWFLKTTDTNLMSIKTLLWLFVHVNQANQLTS